MKGCFLAFYVSSFLPLKFCSEFWRLFSSPRWISVEAWTQLQMKKVEGKTWPQILIQNQNPGEKTAFSSTLSKMSSIGKPQLPRHSWEVHSTVKKDNAVFRSVGLNPGNLKKCCLNWSPSKEICTVASPKWRLAGLSDFLVDTHLQTKKFFSQPKIQANRTYWK